jgi:hypothetical protein
MTVLVDAAIREFIANHRIGADVLQNMGEFQDGLPDIIYGWIYQDEEVGNG